MKKSVLLFLFGTLFIQLFGQLSEGGIPPSFSIDMDKSLTFKDISSEKDFRNLRSEEQNIPGTPLKFAKVFDVRLNTENSGQWHTTKQGDKIWRLGLRSRNAFSLNFTFTKFKLKQGEKIFVYDIAKKYILGAFTSENNNHAELLAVSPLPGDEIIVELFQPKQISGIPDLEIGKIGHDYKGLFLFDDKEKIRGTASQTCEVNINCPQGDDWQIEKRSVCKLIINNSDICTGSLLNNTENNGKPLVLTANHCFESAPNVTNTLFIFNYESENCEGYLGSTSMSISGAKLLAKPPEKKMDFILLEMFHMPPETYNPYYAGWSIDPTPSRKTTCIHHPDGDVKKISIDKDLPEISTISHSTFLDNSFWKIAEWDLGATEKGSSGAPLFDHNHRIIGGLYGGDASCENPINDYFTRLDMAWNTFDNPKEHLKTWLDPINLGVTTMNGLDFYNPTADNDVVLLEILEPKDEYCSLGNINPKIKLRNAGNNVLTSVKIKVKFDDNQETLIDWNGELPQNTTTVIALPDVNLLEGKHTLRVELTKPNNVDDEKPKDNFLDKNFQVFTGQHVSLLLKTDKFGFETSWELASLNNNTMLYNGDNYNNDSEIYKEFCLNTGCYSFTIYDKAQDGICCANHLGEYTLRNEFTGEAIKVGGAFKTHERTDFCINTDFFNKDVAITQVFNINERYCSPEQLKPKIELRNLGKEPLRNCTITYLQNNTEIFSIAYAESLNSMESDTFELPEITIPSGEFEHEFRVSYPDDENIENNSLNIKTITEYSELLSLEIVTDLFGDEVTWEILDSDENRLFSGGPYRQDLVNTIYHEFCLPFGECYRFIMNDNGADGICCRYGKGKFLLKNEFTSDTIAFGKKYGGQIKEEFCMWTSNIDDEEITSEFLIYPNPTSGIFHLNYRRLGEFSVEIFDICGKLLENIKGVSQTLDIDLSQQHSGIYFVRLKSQKHTITKKIMVKK